MCCDASIHFQTRSLGLLDKLQLTFCAAWPKQARLSCWCLNTGGKHLQRSLSPFPFHLPQESRDLEESLLTSLKLLAYSNFFEGSKKKHKGKHGETFLWSFSFQKFTNTLKKEAREISRYFCLTDPDYSLVSWKLKIFWFPIGYITRPEPK